MLGHGSNRNNHQPVYACIVHMNMPFLKWLQNPIQVSFTFKLFLNMFPIYWSNYDKKKNINCWRDLWVGGSQTHAIFRRRRNFRVIKVANKKNFFPTSPNGLKLSQHVVDMYRNICHNFWVDTYIFRYRKVILNFTLLHKVHPQSVTKCTHTKTMYWQ